MSILSAKNFKRIIAVSAAAALTVSVLSSCGKSNNSGASKASQSAGSSLGDNYPTQYKNYIDSFSSEVAPFVKDELPKLLNAVSSLNSSNYEQWKAEYSDDLQKCEHWYNEVSSAEMFCPSENKEQHDALSKTMATIYKILEGMQPRITAADSGDFSQFTAKSTEYAEAANIANDMWNRAIEDINAALK